MQHSESTAEQEPTGVRRAYEPPLLTFEGTLDELTLIPTFIAASYTAP